jgi:hypothetical protein
MRPLGTACLLLSACGRKFSAPLRDSPFVLSLSLRPKNKTTQSVGTGVPTQSVGMRGVTALPSQASAHSCQADAFVDGKPGCQLLNLPRPAIITPFRLVRRSSSVGQSSGIIIHVSGVRIPPPLLIEKQQPGCRSAAGLLFCLRRRKKKPPVGRTRPAAWRVVALAGITIRPAGC